MNYRLISIFLAIGFFIVSLSADVFAGGSINIKWGKDSGSDSREVSKKHKKQGPPAHAPAHGYRAKHQYRYYPSRSVYYDTGRGLYFYLKGDNWEVGASLPGSLRVGLGDSVSIELDTAKPYTHHAEHVKHIRDRAGSSLALLFISAEICACPVECRSAAPLWGIQLG
jgi:hypothetical protein